MNSFALNGASINGGSSSAVIVQAEANIVASASVTAGATYIHEALAAGSGVASVTASPTRTTYGAASISGAGNAYAAQTHIHAAAADVSGSADVVAYVTRVIFGEATLGGTASLEAIPASVLGSADIAAWAGLSATATRITPSSASASASAEVVADGQCFRMALADIQGQAELRAEGVLNGVHDGFCDAIATAEIAPFDSGIVIRQMGADIDCSATCSASATLELFGSSSITTGAEVSVAAVVVLAGVASVTATAEMSPEATRTVLPSTGIIAGCIISAVSAQTHASRASLLGSAEIIPISTVCVPAGAVISASASVAVGTVTSTQSGMAAFSCAATMLAEGRSNADAVDPEERTARRPFTDTVMRRPFIDTVMRRPFIETLIRRAA